MHLMHVIWVLAKLIGFFHEPTVIVCTVMTVVGFALIFVFYKVFERDLFSNSGDD